MLPMVISPTNSRLGHLLMTCSTAAVVSAGGRPCLPGKKQGDLCPAPPEKRFQPILFKFPIKPAGQRCTCHKEPLTVLPTGVNLHHDLQLLG